MVTPQRSLRGILFLTTGTLTLIIALLAAKDVYSDWRRLTDIRALREVTISSDQLFDAVEKLSVERDIALSMMQALDSDTIDDLRPRLIESRLAADGALRASVTALNQFSFPEVAKLRSQMQSHLAVIQKLRPQIDSALNLPKQQRNPDLPKRWSDEITASMQDTENLWVDFVKYFTNIDPIVTQHLGFKQLLRTITDYAGQERSLVGQLIAENATPTPAQIAQLLRGQGIVEASWSMSRSLAGQSGLYPFIAPVYTDASSHYSTLHDMIQDMIYVPNAGGGAEYPISADLWFELANQASDSLGALKTRSIAQTRSYVEDLIAKTAEGITLQVTVFLLALLLCAYSFLVITRRVIRPINQMVVALLQATRGEVVAPVLPTGRQDEIGKLSIVLHAFQQNVEEMKRTTKQLVQAQKMEGVGQLTGGIAHDFNNLLAIIVGNLDLLEEELQPNSKAREMAHDALTASLRGAALTRQLLAFSRRQTLEPRVLSLNEVVSGTTELLRRTLGGRIEIGMRLADDLALALADQTQVESALANMAINARDAMPEGGHLTIETANKYLDEQYQAENPEVTPGNYIMLAVSDTGTGIPPEILERVFEPFFTTKAEGKGSGLGLSMIYGFAKQSRGHVKIYSEVGHGTTIRLYLPRANAAKEAPKDVAPELKTTTETATILVVEDNADVRSVAVRQLTELGYHVIQAANADSALAIIREDRPIDVLFTDVIMPGAMTGDLLAREARRLRPNLRVLFASGFAEASVQNGSRSPEIDGRNLLSKPYRKPDLARRLRETLHSKEDVS
jgi:signal transduction histidine kinase/CheY-like chemotaxis protein